MQIRRYNKTSSGKTKKKKKEEPLQDKTEIHVMRKL